MPAVVSCFDGFSSRNLCGLCFWAVKRLSNTLTAETPSTQGGAENVRPLQLARLTIGKSKPKLEFASRNNSLSLGDAMQIGPMWPTHRYLNP